MLQDLYGGKFESSKLANRIYEIMANPFLSSLGDENAGEMNLNAFEMFSKTHPALLYPAYSFQYKMQCRCLGRLFWERKAHTRLHITGGKTTNVTEFLKTSINEQAHEELISKPFDSKISQQLGGYSTNVDDEDRMIHLRLAAGSVADRRLKKGMMEQTNGGVQVGVKYRSKTAAARARALAEEAEAQAAAEAKRGAAAAAKAAREAAKLKEAEEKKAALIQVREKKVPVTAAEKAKAIRARDAEKKKSEGKGPKGRTSNSAVTPM